MTPTSDSLLRSRACGRQAAAVLGGLLLGGAALLSACATETALPRAGITATPPRATARVHVVAPSETLAQISAQTGVTVERLAELNLLADPNVIEVGTVLRLDDGVLPAAPDSGRYAQPTPDPLRDGLRWARRQAERLASLVPADVRGRLDDVWGEGDRVATGLGIAVLGAAALFAWLLGEGLWRTGRLVVGSLRAARRSPEAGPEMANESHDRAPTGDEPIPIAGMAPSVSPSVAVASERWRSGATIAPLLSLPGRIGRGLMQVPRGAGRSARARRSRRASLDRWWTRGREELRIGLLDEAASLFAAGLAEAEANAWEDEIRMYRDGLAEIAAARPSHVRTPEEPASHRPSS